MAEQTQYVTDEETIIETSPFMSLQQFYDYADKHSTEPLLGNLLHQGVLVILASLKKQGKSTFARHLAVSCASEETEFLGMKWEKNGSVFYVAADESSGMFKDKLKICIGSDALLPIFPTSKMIDLKTLDYEVRTRKPVLVIVDTLNKLLNLKSTEYGEADDKVGFVARLAHETGTCIVLLHHASRPSRHSNSSKRVWLDMESMHGSVAIGSNYDTGMMLNTHSDARIAHIDVDGRLGMGSELGYFDFIIDQRTERVIPVKCPDKSKATNPGYVCEAYTSDKVVVMPEMFVTTEIGFAKTALENVVHKHGEDKGMTRAEARDIINSWIDNGAVRTEKGTKNATLCFLVNR